MRSEFSAIGSWIELVPAALPPRKLVALLIVSLTLAVDMVSAPAWSQPADGSQGYYSDGRWIELSLSTGHVALRLGAPPEPLAGDLDERLRGADERDLPTQRLRLYALAERISGHAIDDLLAALRSRTDVDLVAPVFEAPGALMIVTDRFIAQLADGVDDAALAELNDRHGVEVVEEARWGERTYILQVRQGDALAIANAYHRLPQIVWAHPNFVRVMDRQPPTLRLPNERLVIGPDGRRLPRDTVIPKGADGYRVVERATLSLRGVSRDLLASPEANVPVSKTVIKTEGFEGSFPNTWQLFGSPTWDDETFRSYSGSKSGYCVGSSVAPPGPYPDNAISWMVQGPFSLFDAQDARADIQAWVDTEAGFDDFFLGASTDGNSFNGFALSGNWAAASGGNGFMNIAFDFKRDPGSDLTGQSQVWFALVFQSDFIVADEGVYVDDVVIEKITGGYESLTNDQFDHLQWSLSNNRQLWGTAGADISAPEAWGVSQGSDSIVVAIIDEGVDLTHPDLTPKLVSGYDATGNGSGGGASGDEAHGTNCAGIAAAVTANSQGVAGVARQAKIMPVRVFIGGVTQDSWLADGIDWAADHGADVLSNSWGGGSPSTAITGAINGARSSGRGGKGAAVVFASGNDNGPVSYPASLVQVLAVGSVSPCDQRKAPTSCDGEFWWGSNFGPQLDLTAPGVHMYSTDISGAAGYDPGSYFYNFNGTSSATPVVAGVAALVLGDDPSLTAAQLEGRLTSTADDIGAPGFDNQTGHGRVNAYEALLGTNSNATLSIAKAGSGSGTVTSNPAGINCGGTCSKSYLIGTVVTLTAVPDTGSTFAGWSGPTDCADGSVTMNSSLTCTATFNLLPTHVLSVSKAGTGSGTVVTSPAGISCGGTCQASFPQGSAVDLFGHPSVGSQLDPWSGDADCSDGSVTMSGPRSCVATFSPCAGSSVLNVPPQTVNNTQTFEACNTIRAGNGVFQVGASGNVTFSAGNSIVLENGFSVAAGGVFTAATGIPVSP